MLDNNESKDNWSSWKIYVIKSLDKLQEGQSKLENDFHLCQIDHGNSIVEVKTKIGVWSSVIAAITSLIVTIIAGLVIYSITYNDDDNHYTNNTSKSKYSVPQKMENKTDELF